MNKENKAATQLMYDVVILTDNRYVNPIKKDWYINQVLLEDQLLQTELENNNLKVCKKDWADKEFNWSNTKFAIFRTTWDYFERFNEFFAWIEATQSKTTFINSSEIIKWNIDKHYLKDLENKGINIASTIFIEKGDEISLKELFKNTKWKEAVIKPAVSGAARHTYKIHVEEHNKYEEQFKKLIQQESMLFQVFLKDIEIFGEISLMIIGGEYTHAVRKIAKKGDFRVQDDHGGIVKKHKPLLEEIKFAEKCIQESPYNPLYARVDIVYDNNNKLSLSELELIEPELWFRKNRNSAKKLAEKIAKIISS
tara:strand:+ start:3834 stop:4763 length:930 start_codon:yes stop_codon:yes gene_type:complete